MSKKNLRIIQTMLCIIISLSYMLINSDSCTQGSIDFYVITTIKLYLLVAPFIILDIIGFYKKFKSSLMLEAVRFVAVTIAIMQTVPYLINTTIKGVSLCQGSSDWGGFNNFYGFDSLPDVTSTFERVIPILYLIIPCILIFSCVVNLKKNPM